MEVLLGVERGEAVLCVLIPVPIVLQKLCPTLVWPGLQGCRGMQVRSVGMDRAGQVLSYFLHEDQKAVGSFPELPVSRPGHGCLKGVRLQSRPSSTGHHHWASAGGPSTSGAI